MRTMGAWMLAVGAWVALLSGCDNQNKQADAMEAAPPQTPAPAEYPGDAGATHASYPQPQPQPQPAAHSAAMAPANEPLPDPEPVDTEVQPAPRRDTAKPAARQAPRESYAKSTKSSGRTYTVKKGDTLQEISQKYYGTTKNWRRIHTANRSVIGPNADKLKVGTKLMIP